MYFNGTGIVINLSKKFSIWNNKMKKKKEYLGFRELLRDRRNAKLLHKDPVLIWFEGLMY